MREQAQCIDNMCRYTYLKQIVKCVICILNYIVEEAGALFVGGLTHQSDRERMEDYGIAVNVFMAFVCLKRYFKAEVYIICSHIVYYLSFVTF